MSGVVGVDIVLSAMQQLELSNWRLLQSACARAVQQVMTELLPKLLQQVLPAVQQVVRSWGKPAGKVPVATNTQPTMPLDKKTVLPTVWMPLATLVFNTIQLGESQSLV